MAITVEGMSCEHWAESVEGDADPAALVQAVEAGTAGRTVTPALLRLCDGHDGDWC